MRRVLGVTLTGLGAFLLVLAAMSHFFLPGQVIKFPLNEYSITTLTGSNMSYFSASTGQPVTGASVRAVSTTQGDVTAGSSSTAVWNNVTGVFDITSGASPGTAISYSTERLAFDRRTGVLQNCCGAEIGTTKVHMSGQGYVWPIGTQKKTYQVFNTTLLKPEPANYTGTSTVDGLGVYVFQQTITNQQFGTITLPGSLVNMKNQATVTLPEYLTATYTYDVDPGTGSPVKIVENQSQTLENPTTGATALTLFQGTLTTTPASIQSAVNTAKSSDTEISWVQSIGPLIALIVGVVLMVLGALLVAGENREEYEEYEDDDEEVGAEA
jgi:Porin PorA